MKILMIIGSAIPYPAAPWTRIHSLARGLIRHGHNVLAVGLLTPKSIHTRTRNVVDGIRVIRVPALTFTKIIDFFNAFQSFFAIFLIILVHGSDALIISVPPGGPALGAFLAGKLLRRRVIFDYRDEWEDYPGWRELRFIKAFKKVMTMAYIHSNTVITPTYPFVKTLKSKGVRNVSIIPNGADIDVFHSTKKESIRKALGIANKDFVMIYIGGIGYYYRLDVIVKALSIFIKDKVVPNVVFLIIGHGPEKKVTLDMVKTLHLEGNIRFLGTMYDRSKMAQIIASADVGLIPYDDDFMWKKTLPAKFFEYCACGLPVIANVFEDSELAKLIKKYRIGAVSPPLDYKSLATTIKVLYNDPIFLNEASKRARLLVEQRFDRNKIAKDFVEIVQKLSEDRLD